MNITVALDQLYTTVTDALLKMDLDPDEATVVCDVLMYAQKRDSTQGLIKITEKTILPDADCTPIATIERSSAIANIDGGGHTGMFVLNHAALTAIKLVKNCGIALVNTCNTRSSTGSIGFYARQIAEGGYIALVMAGSPKVMAIQGGIDPVLGTNPIAIAIPTCNEPLVLDMATAATTWFSIIEARNHNQTLAQGVAIDENGRATIDPVKAMSGALRTIAGAKGSGLALMFEALTAPLAGASIVGDPKDNRANTIIAIDPTVVLGNDNYKDSVELLIKRLTESRTVPGTDAIRLPGVSSNALAKKCEQNNLITLDQDLYQQICKIATDSK